MNTTNRIRKIAIVGAGGNVGRCITDSLLKTGRHTVTAITRINSESTFLPGVVTKRVNYDDPQTLEEALTGQDALVITLSGRSPIQETEEKLIKAAGNAGVPWILPNEWSPDSANQGIVEDVPGFAMKVASRDLIEKIGKSCFIAVVTGFWYEQSLSNPLNYGFDIANRIVTFYDKGEVMISTTTLPQIGRGVASLLSLPITSEGSNTKGCLEDFKNKVIYINSFTVNQKKMLASIQRVSESADADWQVVNQSAKERFNVAVKEIADGKKEGYSKLAARVFFPDGCGDFEHNKGTINSLLGLPEEDIDEFSKAAIKHQTNSH